MTGTGLPPLEVLAWAEQHTEQVRSDEPAARRQVRGGVWRLITPRGPFYLKIAAGRRMYEREVRAYRHVVSDLGARRAPRLVESTPQHLALLVTGLPGAPVDELHLDPVARREVHRQAGTLARTLHDASLPTAPEHMRVKEDLAAAPASAEKHLEAVGELLNVSERALVRELAERLPVLEPLPVGFVHGDWQERNWLLHHGRLGVLDFERARHAHVVTDLVRLAWGGAWAEDTSLRAAFLEGYGRPLSDGEEAALPALAALDAASALAFAQHSGDIEIAQRARRTLAALAPGGAG